MPIDLPVGVFRDKSIPEAIKIYLAAGRRKQTVKEIAAGLKNGGLVTTATNFEATVTGSLHRLRSSGAVLRFKEGWDLADSYPENLRNRRLERDDRPRRNTNTRRRQQKASSKKKVAAAKTATTEKSSDESVDRRIAAFLAAHQNQYFTPQQIAEALGEDYARAFTMAFARLSRFGKVTRREDGSYAAKRATVEQSI